MDLCQEGDEPTCLWLLEGGEVAVFNLGCEEHCVLRAPAVFGDAVMAASGIPACRDRVWGYQTLTTCRLWRLSLKDLTAAIRVCPGLAERYLEHVQARLLRVRETLICSSLPKGYAPAFPKAKGNLW